METALVWFDQARQALMQAKSFDEVKEIRDKAEALRLYTKQAGDGLEMQNWCAEIKLRAERRAGELLKETVNHQGSRGVGLTLEPTLPPSISKQQSHRWQTIASLPEPDFEAHITEAKTAGHELTSADVYRLAQKAHQPVPVETPAFPFTTFRCLVIDPPWPVGKRFREVHPRQGPWLDYATMELEEIEALPIPMLAEPSGCHVYLWVTHHLLPDGLRLFAAWGVTYHCLMTWVKNVGMTPFSWMFDTEHVLFGRIGHLDLLQHGLRLSFSAAVQGHSIKPDVFYERVCLASPGPRLEMFARSSHDGFEPWGAEAGIVP